MAERFDRRTFIALLTMAAVDAVAHRCRACRRQTRRRARCRASRPRSRVESHAARLRRADLRSAGHSWWPREDDSQAIQERRAMPRPAHLRIFNNHHWTMKYIKLMGLESKLDRVRG